MGYLASHFRMAGQYEPEGIYLAVPLDGDFRILQGWGAHPDFHSRYTYNGVPLKGHPGLDLSAASNARVLAADSGRVVTLSNEPGGFGRHIKLEHPWGESLYAHLGTILVESGQTVERGQVIAHVERPPGAYPTHLHFAIRTSPFNRFDGWGGFSDPLPFLYVVEMPTDDAGADAVEERLELLPPMVLEKPGMRRP